MERGSTTGRPAGELNGTGDKELGVGGRRRQRQRTGRRFVWWWSGSGEKAAQVVTMEERSEAEAREQRHAAVRSPLRRDKCNKRGLGWAGQWPVIWVS
jgi:hypothetical protein